MKALWALLAGVVLLGVAAAFWPLGGAREGAESPRAADTPAEREATAPVSDTTRSAPKPPQAAPASSDVASASPAASNSKSAAAAVAAPPAAPADAASRPSSSTTAASISSPGHSSAAVTPAAGGLTLGLDRTIAHATIAPGSVLRKPDGSLLADGKFRIEGEGTREKPYRISWELLAASSRTYVPRLKQDRIPQCVAMLDGAWIRIDGYVAFPLMLQESAEVLVMLNQWDGCCIGVPPTPYDALEVKLAQPVKPSKRHSLNFGSVTGRMRVDPLLVENWLVGLYRLEEATLTQDGL